MSATDRPAHDAVAEYAASAIRLGSRSFARAASLFDREMRERAHLLYAWCRYCDDQVDGQQYGYVSTVPVAPRGTARERLDLLEARTADALRGRVVRDPPFLALQQLVERCAIPERHPFELLAGFRMDVEARTYRSLDDVLTYCYHVAGVVGVMMAHVMGVRDDATLDRAADLGIAFQLTNISRDVADDARSGRVYLPLEWLEESGLAQQDLAAADAWPTVVPLVHRLLDEADRYYASAAAGLRGLRFRSAWAVAAALGIYRDIGRVIRSRGAARWSQRAVVSAPRKAYRVGWALIRAAAAVSVERRRSETRPTGLLTRPASARPTP